MNTNTIKFLSYIFIYSLTACGNDIYLPGISRDDKQDDNQPEPASPKIFSGAIGGAFEVTVDGIRYNDMEDFYTQEVGRLPEKVQQAGYDASWEPEFEAQLGLRDLWYNMVVYISPNETIGYQSQTFVGQSGRFETEMPGNSVGHTYRVRANKRISILLKRGEASKRLCYNFSAIEKSILFQADGLPIIIDTFASTITAYDCASDSASGTAALPGTTAPETIEPGQTKSQVTQLLGLTGLTAESPIAWCWAFRATPDSPCAVDLGETSCDCRVEFNSNGLVSSHSGISPSFLKK